MLTHFSFFGARFSFLGARFSFLGARFSFLGARSMGLAAVLSVAAMAVGCSKGETDDTDGSEDALRADPNAHVLTQDPSVRLLGGYNAFLDRAPTTACVTTGDTSAVNIGDVRGEFYLKNVNTKEQLAKELEVDVGASLKLPRGSVDASTKVVTTFKSSATTATFVVRAVRSYAVTARGTLQLTDEAAALDTNKFLQTCGGSFAKSLRYEAQVVGIMKFEARTEEAARNIETALSGGASGIPRIASATADLKTKAQETASRNNASLSITIAATGFLSRTGSTVGDVSERTFEKIDELRADMNASFDADLEKDREGYFTNTSRNVRPREVLQASYAQLPNAPATVDFGRITTTLARAEEFFDGVASTQVRVESVYTDEIDRFLNDTQRWGGDQFRYNVLPAPKLKTTDVVPIAQSYAAKFRPNGSPQGEGTVVKPLRMAIERCLAAAGNGDYSACTTDAVIEQSKNDAELALTEYTDRGRIVPLVAWVPTLGERVSYRNAEPRCRELAMRLPKRSEMALIGPAVTALGGPTGDVWFAGDAQCAKPVFTNNSGQGAVTCEDTASEALPYVGDHQIVCVGFNGPVAALPRP
jgi:hypothetical protein